MGRAAELVGELVHIVAMQADRHEIIKRRELQLTVGQMQDAVILGMVVGVADRQVEERSQDECLARLRGAQQTVE
jgi:hypothetical protein